MRLVRYIPKKYCIGKTFFCCYFYIKSEENSFFLRYLYFYSIKCLKLFFFSFFMWIILVLKCKFYQVNIFFFAIKLYIHVCMRVWVCVANTIFSWFYGSGQFLFVCYVFIGTTICLSLFCVGISSKTFMTFSMILTIKCVFFQ